jgi:glycyl-tRNA synthetase beta chain
LKQNQGTLADEVDVKLLEESAEKALVSALDTISTTLKPMLDSNDYAGTLTSLAKLRDPVDNFFDEVMVMCEDEAIKLNRLALLNQLNNLFISTADISKLQAQQD